MGPSFGLKSNRIVVPGQTLSGTLIIANGVIEGIVPKETDYQGPVEDVGDWVIMPGLIDPHVHVNEPGRTEWEGFETATRAAAAGGITTLVDMPLNSDPVTTTVDNLVAKRNSAEGKMHVNCGFWGGVIPGNADRIMELADAGVMGFKAFLTHSGIPEFPNVQRADLEIAMPIIKETGLPLLVHAELDRVHEGMTRWDGSPGNYMSFLASRPKDWEERAIDMMIDLAERTGCRTHIVHLSAASAVTSIEQAKFRNLPFTVETCPHYLYFQAETIPDGDSVYKCAPPIRERENNHQLWEALGSGFFDFICTDHSPTTPEMKRMGNKDLRLAWGGISGLQFLLPALWSGACPRGISLNEVSMLTSGRAADFLGLKKKGRIKVGYDADLMIWDPEETFVPTNQSLVHRHKFSPYVGKKLLGKIRSTFVGGVKVYDQEEHFGSGQGRFVRPD